MRKLIHFVLGSTAAIALVASGVACSRSRDANTPSGVQSSTPAAERVNPGSGYYGSAPENVNRPTTAPTAIGGGPGMGTSSAGVGTDSEVTGGEQSGVTDTGGGTTDTNKKTKKPSTTNGGGTDQTGGSDKGSGTTGGTQQK